MSMKYFCHSCYNEITTKQANICDKCYELDKFCDCFECIKLRENFSNELL